MLSLEQVRLLEAKVGRTVEYVERLTADNAALKKKLSTNQKRIDELEVLISKFKEEQGRIEDGILSALDRLSQFESAIEKSLSGRGKEAKPAAAGRDKTAQAPESPQKQKADALQEIPPSAENIPVQNEEIQIDIQDPLETDSGSGNGELDIF